MSTSDRCKDGASKSNDDGVCENGMLQNMSLNDTDVVVSVCANCGKEGSSDNMNVCNKCTMVKYCNAVCKKVHKKKHKKDCEEHIRLAAERAAKLHDEELRIAAELHDKELFKQPPPDDDCPICFLLLPSLASGSAYYNCCGKRLCCGCAHAPVFDNHGNEVTEKVCPFCRTPRATTGEENMKRHQKRVEAGDAIAIYDLGVYHRNGLNGYQQDYKKALECYQRAGEMGFTEAYVSIGYAYDHGKGVEVDENKATHYYELAAIGGDINARHNLGIDEARAGNLDRALRHFKIGARSGYDNSLLFIKDMYTNGHATKEDYTKALQSYQAYLNEIKSRQRDEAVAIDERCRYY